MSFDGNEKSPALGDSAATGNGAHAWPSFLPALPGEDREAQLLWQLRYQSTRTLVRQLFTTARLRTFLVVTLSAFFWLGLFMLFYEGFTFIVVHVGAAGATYHAQTVRFVFHLFFASLNVMLVFSSAIIMYSGLYSSPDTTYMLTLPIRPERIVLFKFQEAVFYSSWGFFLLASPIMAAYGIVAGAPWYYYVLLVPLIVSFVYIPCSIGAICCLLVIHKLPKLRRIVVGVAVAAVVVFLTPLVWRTVSSPQSRLFGNEWFQETLYRFRFTQQEWLPSTWLTNGLLEAARKTAWVANDRVSDLPIVQSVLYLALLVSNALFLHVVTVWVGKHWFRASYANFACRRTRNRIGANGLFRSHCGRASFALSSAYSVAAYQRLAIAAARSGSMVAVSNLLRPLGALLSERRPVQQSTQRHWLRDVD